MVLALAVAVLAATGYAGGALCQAVAARRASGLAAAIAPLALLGWGLDIASRLVAILAFQRLPLFVVEAILATQLIGVLLGARLWLGLRPRLWDGLAAVAVVGAVVLLSLGCQTGPIEGTPAAAVICLVAGGGLTVALLLGYRAGSPIVMSVLSGLGYSLAAISAREADLSGLLLDMIFQPFTFSMLLGGLCGGLAYIRAVERGGAAGVCAVTSVIGVLLPGLVGIFFLGDAIVAGWAVVNGLAVALSLAGCVVLARGPVGHLNAPLPVGQIALAPA